MVFYNAVGAVGSGPEGVGQTQPGGMDAATNSDNDAKRAEEQSIHSLYRLVSRSVQALSLIDLLTYAHELDGVPGVDWGCLSGVMFKSWVVDREVHERVKGVLTGVTSYARELGKATSDFAR